MAVEFAWCELDVVLYFEAVAVVELVVDEGDDVGDDDGDGDDGDGDEEDCCDDGGDCFFVVV